MLKNFPIEIPYTSLIDGKNELNCFIMKNQKIFNYGSQDQLGLVLYPLRQEKGYMIYDVDKDYSGFQTALSLVSYTCIPAFKFFFVGLLFVVLRFLKDAFFFPQVQIIWNSSTRSELLTFVEEQRTSQDHDGLYDLKDSHEFAYTSLSKELCVGNVYLRVYNDQPDFEISEPEGFCIALVDFIFSLVHEQNPSASLLQSIEDVTASRDTKSESANEMEDQFHEEQSGPNDSLVMSDAKVSEEDESSPLKKLRSALTSLKVNKFLCIRYERELLIQLSLFWIICVAEPAD